jgi:hypothetical protein
LTSSDAVTWTPRVSATTNGLRGGDLRQRAVCGRWREPRDSDVFRWSGVG